MNLSECGNLQDGHRPPQGALCGALLALACLSCNDDRLAGNSVDLGNPPGLTLSFSDGRGPAVFSGRVLVLPSGYNPFDLRDTLLDTALSADSSLEIPARRLRSFLASDDSIRISIMLSGEAGSALATGFTYDSRKRRFLYRDGDSLVSLRDSGWALPLGRVRDILAPVPDSLIAVGAGGYAFIPGTPFQAPVEGGYFRLRDLPLGNFRIRFTDGKAKTFADAPLNNFLEVDSTGTGSRILRLGAGQTLSLAQDLVLSERDTLDAQGVPGNRCRILGNGHTLKAAAFRGRISLYYCDLQGLGGASLPSLSVTALSGAHLEAIASVFDACGMIQVDNADSSTAVFRDNVFQANASVPVLQNSLEQSRPFLRAGGAGTGRKVFQGNSVYKSWLDLHGPLNWSIGGTADGQGNVFVGQRCGITIYGSGHRIAGNYFHPIHDPNAAITAPLTVLGDTGLVIEHNVFHGGQTVLRGLSGHFRYNLVLQSSDVQSWITGPDTLASIHHNVFLRYAASSALTTAGIQIVYGVPGVSIYGNTFDGGGMQAPLIHLKKGRWLESFRNNAVTGFRFRYPALSPTSIDTFDPGPYPGGNDTAFLEYADYNLFHNPGSTVLDNYGVPVRGKTERQDSGFARNDIPVSGAVDAQADPKWQGPVPAAFPFPDDDIKARKTKVLDILAYYRKAYSPGPGSPLIDAGNPADGPGVDIGAIGTGLSDSADRFGNP